MRSILAFLVALSLGLTGCDALPDSDAPDAQVSVQFEVVTPAAGVAKGSSAHALDEVLLIEGTNGTLAITDIRMVVAEFELEREDEACDDDERGDDCEAFSAPPFFVDLPLEREAVTVATGTLPPGAYTELEFEVEDLELDEDEGDDRVLQDLFDEIRTAFPDWPGEASLVVTGDFTPRGGSARPFTVFAEAEIEVELELEPPLVITAEDDNPSLTVAVNPVFWFKTRDGRVQDLSAFDYETTGELLEFELEIERGFTELEIELEDDD